MTTTAIGSTQITLPAGVAGATRLVRPRAVHTRQPSPIRSIAFRVLGPALLLVAWWAGSASGYISQQTLAGPGRVADTLWAMAQSGELAHHLSVSMHRALLGLVLGVSIGLVLGIVAGFFTLGEELVDSTMQILRTIPFLAVMPLLIIWFGIDEKPKIILIMLATTFPMYINTYGGVRSVDSKLIEAGRVFGCSRLQLVREIVLPQALPSILVGLRLSMSISLIALIGAEQLNATSGIGYLVTAARQFFQTDVLVIAILIYAAFGLVIDLSVRLLERLAMPWRRAGAVR